MHITVWYDSAVSAGLLTAPLVLHIAAVQQMPPPSTAHCHTAAPIAAVAQKTKHHHNFQHEPPIHRDTVPHSSWVHSQSHARLSLPTAKYAQQLLRAAALAVAVQHSTANTTNPQPAETRPAACCTLLRGWGHCQPPHRYS